MSANKAVTVLRSPSAEAESGCSGAIRTGGAEDARAVDLVASEVSGSAHSAQNFASCAFARAHFGHARLSGVAH
jgi:hypothetical protein